MFIIEQSQLLEDNINNHEVLKLYKILRQNEAHNERAPLIEGILTNEKCLRLNELLLDSCETNKVPLNEPLGNEIVRFTSDQRENIIEKLELDKNDTAALALIVAATLNQLFVIDNFVGPTNGEILEQSDKDLLDVYKNLSKQIDFRSLSRDGSEVSHRIVNPWLLKLVQLYWILLNNLGCSRRLLELEFLVWKHRYLTIHLSILLEPSETLVNELRKIQEFIFDHHIICVDSKDNNTQLVRFNLVELCCELVQASLHRDSLTCCRKFLDYAVEVSGIEVEHTGVLGKRTKFQQKDIPQLVVKVTKKDKGDTTYEPIPRIETDSDTLNDVKLDDDTLLPDISFVNQGETAESVDDKLTPEAQLIMMNKLDLLLRGEVMEESLKDEWTSAYLRALTSSATIWSLKYKSLALRSTVEKKHMRKVDRALMQMEELIKVGERSCAESRHRLRSFYSVLPNSIWQMQKNLGDISLDLGLCKNALDIYTRIEYWEGMISCYRALGQTVKAEKIIRQELDKQETPYLYCLLGDATELIEYYEKSWTLSKGRFARAKKSIGTYYYVRKQYDDAIENYELALGASPSNLSILSLLGYSCLLTERYERAAECYRNITYQDDSNFLAWNNLSKAYIKLDQKERAWRTLREALKCNYEEWKVWDNFMVVSMDIGALDDVILAWHRLLDIKKSHKDDQMLSALTFALINRPLGETNADHSKLMNDALKLVARLISTTECSPRLWVCYYKILIKEYELFRSKSLKSDETKSVKIDVDSRISKITNALQRSNPTSLTAEANWSQVPEKIHKVLDTYDEIIDCYMYAIETIGPRPEIWRQWKYFKLSINNVMKILEKTSISITNS